MSVLSDELIINQSFFPSVLFCVDTVCYPVFSQAQ